MSSNVDPKKQTAAAVDEDDDLDDLDDVLTQFQAPPKPKPSTSGQQKSEVGSSKSHKDSDLDTDGLPDELAAELAVQMEEMLRNLNMAQPDANAGGGQKIDQQSLEQEQKFRKLWEDMLIDGMDGKDDSPADKELDAIFRDALKLPEASGSNSVKGPSKSTADPPSGEDSFQNAIRQAMEKIKSSDETLKQNESESSDPLADLLSQLGDLSGEGAEGMDGMIEQMLGAIMSKEVLYDPIKELSTQYPGYLSSHAELPTKDRKRYEEQMKIANRILEVFEKPDYSDENTDAQAEVFRLMNDMQQLGSPPAEIMGELPNGITPEGLANGDGCIIS